MKIAKEIAEKIHSWVDNVMFCEYNGQPSLTEPTVEQLTAYLDAKLEPVKALAKTIEVTARCEHVNPDGCSPMMAIAEIEKKANAILALFEEE